MKRKLIAFCLLLFISASFSSAQDTRVYPSHWWAGMKNPKLQLMVHSPGIKDAYRSLEINYPGVKLDKVTKVEGANYIFVDLTLSSGVKPGTIKLKFNRNNAAPLIIDYSIKARNSQNGKSRVQGVTSKDFVYLMMPDRFSNGDPSNDIISEYREQLCDRKNKFSRHGGDFKGIENHLDYFEELGVTTLWLTPVLENNMPLMNEWGNSVAGYHGYWFTDHYEIDKRFGGNEGYKKFCNTLHQKGMKVIQDAVYNHVGNYHWSVLDPPMNDWLNQWPAFQGPNHREEALFDPYASAFDKKIMLDGWFVPHLPDLNQRNPYVANYLIQHAIWSTEEFGIDGWRVDTYKYCDEKFLNNVNAALEREFPAVTVFGEAWVNSVIGNAYFTRNNIVAPFKHNAEGVIDFQSCFAMLAGMNEQFGWTQGVNKIYMTLAQDLVYQQPLNNCIFLDNHDMDRVYSVVDEDWKKLRMGINWLLTLRGIPQMYYGTEVLMKNKKTNSDAAVREDFPGGWPDDKEKDNRFTKKGRSDEQDQAFSYVSSLARFRKTSSALTTGKTMQFIPKDGLYLYFRYDDKQTVMVIANTGTKTVKPDLNVYQERLKNYKSVRNVVSGKTKSLQDIELEPGESFVFELIN
jgi:neopullulanase